MCVCVCVSPFFRALLKLGEEQAQAQQVTVCLKVAQRAKRVVMLSGTPSLSKPFDLFNQVECCLAPLALRSKVAGKAGMPAKNKAESQEQCLVGMLSGDVGFS